MNRKPNLAPASRMISAWIGRFAPLIPDSGRILDLAAGGGRHSLFFLARGARVVAADRDVSALLPLRGAQPRLTVVETDLESGGDWRLGDAYDGIIVTNYLHRPLFPAIAAALAPGGILLYETFALGNEHFGRPSNPDFLLRPGELLAAFPGLSIIAFEQGLVDTPQPAAIQRLAAVRGEDLRALPG